MNLENYHAIDCTEGQEWSEKEKNFFVLCAYTRRKEELEKFFEAITSVRESSKDISERVSAVCSHGVCQAHKEVFMQEVREMKQSRSCLGQEAV